ncbi:MAG: D-alanine--D-alanine ligase [Candidatus Zixiibacteriota bacterium]
MERTSTVVGANYRESVPGEVELRVLVLAGGKSSERDVSLASGDAISQALSGSGHTVFRLDPGVTMRAVEWQPQPTGQKIGTAPPDQSTLASVGGGTGTILSPADLPLADLRSVDVVLIALHGGDGEDGHLQALLDLANIPYTGSGMLASALAMDKNAAKRIFVAEGIPTPEWRVLDAPTDWEFADLSDALGLPLVVKPNAQGSTVGLTLVKDASQWAPALKQAFHWGPRVIAEQYIPGRELTVGVLGDKPLPVVEIRPKHGIYDYECKYTPGQTEYICPAPLSAPQTRIVQEQGMEAFRALGCRGYARADFRMDPDGNVYCLEMNTLPGMTSLSLVPQAAKSAGIEFPELLRRICDLALEGK